MFATLFQSICTLIPNYEKVTMIPITHLLRIRKGRFWEQQFHDFPQLALIIVISCNFLLNLEFSGPPPTYLQLLSVEEEEHSLQLRVAASSFLRYSFGRLEAILQELLGPYLLLGIYDQLHAAKSNAGDPVNTSTTQA